MQSQASKIVLAVIITAVVVGGGAYFWPTKQTVEKRQDNQNKQDDVEITTDERQNYLVDTLKLFQKSDAIVFIERATGRISETEELKRSGPRKGDKSVLVDHILLTEPGYAAVFEGGPSSPRHIIGQSKPYPAGRHDNVNITLTRPLTETTLAQVYGITLYHDMVQDEDIYATNETGEPVETNFTVER